MFWIWVYYFKHQSWHWVPRFGCYRELKKMAEIGPRRVHGRCNLNNKQMPCPVPLPNNLKQVGSIYERTKWVGRRVSLPPLCLEESVRTTPKWSAASESTGRFGTPAGGEGACTFFDEVVFSRKVRKHAVTWASVYAQSKKGYHDIQLAHRCKHVGLFVTGAKFKLYIVNT